jgi:hypothetical protein
MLNLIWKWFAKDPKKKEYHKICMNFVVKRFIVKNTKNKKEALLFECCNLMDSME